MKWWFVILAFGLTLMVGCASNTQKPVVIVKQAMIPTETINVNHRKALAQQYFQQQDFHASLTQWQILKAIDPENPEYLNRIRVLEALINRRIKQYLSNGKESLEKDNLSLAENNLLHVLALDPRNAFALNMMREIESKRVHKVQIAKTSKLLKKQQAKHEAEKLRQEQKAAKVVEIEDSTGEENVSDLGVQEAFYLDMGKELFNEKDWNGAIREINKYLSSNKSTPEIRQMLNKAHIKMSMMFDARGHWDPAIQHLTEAIENSDSDSESQQLMSRREQLKQKAAEKYYIEGVKVYRDNVDTAITFWKQALLHNPHHDKAGNRLKIAEQLKHNLQTISQ